MLISVFAFIWQTYIIIAFFLFFFNEAGQMKKTGNFCNFETFMRDEWSNR